MKKYERDSCHDNDEHICRTRILGEIPSIVKTPDVQNSLAAPFLIEKEIVWRKRPGELKSKNILKCFSLLKIKGETAISEILTGH